MTLPNPGPATTRIMLGIFAALAAATLARGIARVARTDRDTRERWASLGTWWVLAVALVLILILGRPAVVITAAAISLLVLAECLRLVGAERLLPWAILAVGGLYLWAWLDWASLFLGALPLALGAFLLGEAAWRLGRRSHSEEHLLTGSLVLVAVVGPSFVVAAASLPAPAALAGEALPWFLLLLLLTVVNDVAQAWFGKTFGSRPLAPVLSPHKTWEGLLGGVATTAAAAAFVAPMITNYGRGTPRIAESWLPPWTWPVALGLLVALAGIAGDLSASALKRHAGVKDSGRLLPGHGGALDRFDSLAMTAPAFFLLTWLSWFPPE